MNRVLVLGGNGMLGATLVRWFAAQPGFAVCATSRSGMPPAGLGIVANRVQWLPLDVDYTNVNALKHLCAGYDLVINAIGRIKQRIRDGSLTDREESLLANALFAVMLAQAAEAARFSVVQIATDCVFSGSRGHYIEADKHDAEDLYGLSKSLGEIRSPNVFNLRCSMVGLELASTYSLLNWFLGHAPGATVQGYTNHHWNGVTALHFAKICGGLLSCGRNEAFDTHVVPANTLTKYDLLGVFADAFDRKDLKIVPTEAPQCIDRTLATSHPDLNAKLWKNAGYSGPPSIQDMVLEMASHAASWK